MPGLDSTGPMGQGSQTGRKMGRCGTENEIHENELPRGRGSRRGLNRKMRFGNGWGSPGNGKGRGLGRSIV